MEEDALLVVPTMRLKQGSSLRTKELVLLQPQHKLHISYHFHLEARWSDSSTGKAREFSLIGCQSSGSDRIWDALYRCFPRIRAVLAFSPTNINDTSNAITMWGPMHEMFGRFQLSFESTVCILMSSSSLRSSVY